MHENHAISSHTRTVQKIRRVHSHSRVHTCVHALITSSSCHYIVHHGSACELFDIHLISFACFSILGLASPLDAAFVALNVKTVSFFVSLIFQSCLKHLVARSDVHHKRHCITLNASHCMHTLHCTYVDYAWGIYC